MVTRHYLVVTQSIPISQSHSILCIFLFFFLLQVNEAPSSGAMEVIGFERGLEQLRALGVDVGLLTTDRSPSIRKVMSSKYEGVIKHEFDAWHVGKSKCTLHHQGFPKWMP